MINSYVYANVQMLLIIVDVDLVVELAKFPPFRFLRRLQQSCSHLIPSFIVLEKGLHLPQIISATEKIMTSVSYHMCKKLQR